MALLSRYPIAAAQDLSGFLWADLPHALLSDDTGAPLFPTAVLRDLRLASVAQWRVEVTAPQGRITLFAFHAGPPVFDGPVDRNGRRNLPSFLLTSRTGLAFTAGCVPHSMAAPRWGAFLHGFLVVLSPRGLDIYRPRSALPPEAIRKARRAGTPYGTYPTRGLPDCPLGIRVGNRQRADCP